MPRRWSGFSQFRHLDTYQNDERLAEIEAVEARLERERREGMKAKLEGLANVKVGREGLTSEQRRKYTELVDKYIEKARQAGKPVHGRHRVPYELNALRWAVHTKDNPELFNNFKRRQNSTIQSINFLHRVRRAKLRKQAKEEEPKKRPVSRVKWNAV